MRIAIVHYHPGPGGVAAVIRSSLPDAPHVILAGESPTAVENLPLRVVDGLGYSDDASLAAAESLVQRMRRTAAEALGGPPDVWHFHNHSLGKNPALTRAAAMLVASGERALFHIHDLAEDGRPLLYQKLRRVPERFPVTPRVRYGFINSRDRDLFLKAGLPEENAVILPNPITAKPLVSNIKSQAPLIFAPIRSIRRKNLGELVLLSVLSPVNAHFAISRAPLDPADRRVHDRWKLFAREFARRIEFDVTDRIAPALGEDAGFDSWLGQSTHIAGTSVAEGFGLPFLESAAWRKPFIGRKLAHLEHDLPHARLYDRLLIPSDWIARSVLTDHLRVTLERNHRAWLKPLPQSHIDETLDHLWGDGWLDFGNLPEALQQGIIERCAEAEERKVPLVESDGVREPTATWLDRVISETISEEAFTLPETFAQDHCRKQLAEIYQSLMAVPSCDLRLVMETGVEPQISQIAQTWEKLGQSNQWNCPLPPNLFQSVESVVKNHGPTLAPSEFRFIDPERILAPFLRPGAFHFLLSAPAPIGRRPDRFRAVIFDVYGTLLIAPPGSVRPDPAVDDVLRQIITRFGHTPPPSPTTALTEAVARHHQAARVDHPEVDLRVLWREVLNLPPDHDATALIIATEDARLPTRLMPGAQEAVSHLAAAGVPLGLLSNAQCHTLHSLGGIADLFDAGLTVLSYQHGIAKPSPELFAVLTKRLAAPGIAPKDCLFIGNDPLQDIAPAAAAGYQTALFAGHPDSFRAGDATPDFILRTWAELRDIASVSV
jgi:FMN phosphatase YigB (HAD superfamily)